MKDRTVEIELTARVHRENDAYWAEIVQLPGCFASGQTLDELAQALSEAISVYRMETSETTDIVAGESIRSLEVGEMKILVPAGSQANS